MIAQGFGGKPDGEVTDDQTIRGDDVIAEYFSTLKTIPKRTYMLGADGISWTELPKVGPSLLSLSARIFRVKGLGLRVEGSGFVSPWLGCLLRRRLHATVPRL